MKKAITRTAKKIAKSSVRLPAGYGKLLEALKKKIRSSQVKAALAVNQEFILLYHYIGKKILDRQKNEGWGAKVIDRLSHDLMVSFPDVKGFSSRNLKYMRAFSEAYPESPFVQQLAAQIPWFHHCSILDKIKERKVREFYIHKTIENGWSRNVLVHQIEGQLHKRQGRSTTNFLDTLSKPHSEVAQQTLKDPYLFDFLNLGEDVKERELERSLLTHLRDFLIELGVGFSFVGSQYHLEVGEKDFYVDLLFYHLRLRCFVVLDLKVCDFEPEFAGKMNFYLSAVDSQLRHQDDHPSIGIILCKSKNKMIAEYALRDTRKPMGVSAYKLVHSLPKSLKGQLPTIAELEEKLRQDIKKQN